MKCSNCNHSMLEDHTHCPQCNFPSKQQRIAEPEKDPKYIDCLNCGTSNEVHRHRCLSCNMGLSEHKPGKKEGRETTIYPLNTQASDPHFFPSFTPNGKTQISRS